MSVESEFMWERWTRAVDQLAAAADELRGLTHLPDGHPHKCDAWIKVKGAQVALERAARALEPRFRTS